MATSTHPHPCVGASHSQGPLLSNHILPLAGFAIKPRPVSVLLYPIGLHISKHLAWIYNLTCPVTVKLWAVHLCLPLIAWTILAQAACVRCHGTKCPLLMALFSFFLSLSPLGYFSPRRSYHRVLKFAWGFGSHKNKILIFKKFGPPHSPPWGRLFRGGGVFRKNEKCLESPEMARTLIRIDQICWPPVPDMCASRISRLVDWLGLIHLGNLMFNFILKKTKISVSNYLYTVFFLTKVDSTILMG